MIYSINYNDDLIKYDKTTVPPDINFIDYLEFEINDYNYVLNENDIERIFGGFIENYVEEYPNENEYKILLTKINDMLLDISHLTVKELYNELKEPDFTNTYVDEWLPFDDIPHHKKSQKLFILAKFILGTTNTQDLPVKIE